jgi:hypothetical protein
MIVTSAIATPGPSLSRIMPRARGSAAPIKKRMTHITVIIGPKPEELEDDSKAKKPAEGQQKGCQSLKSPNKPHVTSLNRIILWDKK